jgi:tRNA G18 (ribose-2'-O)-methylase SpoU
MKASKKVFELPLAEPCCIVMGSEDKGVQAYIRKAADEHFTIPWRVISIRSTSPSLPGSSYMKP